MRNGIQYRQCHFSAKNMASARERAIVNRKDQKDHWLHWKGRLSNFHFQGKEPDIFVFATPRSGSTFLMELLQSQPGMKLFNEIFSMNRPAIRRELGASSWAESTCLPDRKVVYEEYIRRLTSNKIPELNRPFYWKTGRLFSSRHVLKIIHGGEDMLPWFTETFDAKILLLVRHPIPTALSSKRLPRLEHYMNQPELRNTFTRDQVRLITAAIESTDFFMQAIVDWCVQNKPMLSDYKSAKATLISYEDLTIFPHESFSYLQSAVGLSDIKNLDRLIRRPSRSTALSDDQTRQFLDKANRSNDRMYLIEKWLTRVSEDEIKLADELLNVFEIDIYNSKDPFPTEEYRIPKLQRL